MNIFGAASKNVDGSMNDSLQVYDGSSWDPARGSASLCRSVSPAKGARPAKSRHG